MRRQPPCEEFTTPPRTRGTRERFFDAAASLLAAGFLWSFASGCNDGKIPAPRVHRPAPVPAGADPGRPRSLREAYPDYRPGADDPELDAVREGRRRVERHSIPLEDGGAASIESLVRSVVDAVSAGDGRALTRLTISRRDFVEILWPEFPESRPAANLAAGDAWGFVERKNVVCLNRSVSDHLEDPIALVSFKVGAVRPYTNFKIHTDLTVIVRSASGRMMEFTTLRSIVERNGRFKIYSTRD